MEQGHRDPHRSLDLVRRAQEGEMPALSQLFERYYERVRHLVRMRLGPDLRGALDSGDICQNTFIAAVQAFDRFEMKHERSLLHWLGKIAEHQIRDAADYNFALKRDRKREVALRHILESQASGDLVCELADPAPDPAQLLSDGEETRVVEGELHKLRADYRDVILLRDFERASWQEVAECLGSPGPNAARMLYARALTHLTESVRRRRRKHSAGDGGTPA